MDLGPSQYKIVIIILPLISISSNSNKEMRIMCKTPKVLIPLCFMLRLTCSNIEETSFYGLPHATFGVMAYFNLFELGNKIN